MLEHQNKGVSVTHASAELLKAKSSFGGVWERQIRSIRNVMSGLVWEHGNRLDEESLRTFLSEAESPINNRPLTVETLSDPLSESPLPPSMLLTGKTKLVLRPPGEFLKREDLYCRRNLKVEDVVLLKENQSPRNRWRLGKVVATHPDDQEQSDRWQCWQAMASNGKACQQDRFTFRGATKRNSKLLLLSSDWMEFFSRRNT